MVMRQMFWKKVRLHLFAEQFQQQTLFYLYSQKENMSIYRQMLQDDLDRKINRQYLAISTNQIQQERAQRLLKPQENIQSTQLSFSNQQILRYVNEVYHKYGIQDPILRMRKERGIFSSYINNKNKQANLSDRLTKTKKKLINLKEKFKNDREQVIKKQIFNTSFEKESFNPSKITNEKSNKAIGYRTKQKIRFKTVTEQIQTLQSPYLTRQELNYSYNQTRNQSLSFSITNRKQAEKKIIQFCPYCQQNLTLTTYKTHQIKCTAFREIEHISDENLINLIRFKINEVQHRLLLDINKQTPQNLVEQFKKLRQSLINQIQTGKNISLEVINSDFNRFSINLCKELNKLRWFRDFHGSLYLSRPFDPYL